MKKLKPSQMLELVLTLKGGTPKTRRKAILELAKRFGITEEDLALALIEAMRPITELRRALKQRKKAKLQ